MDKSYEMKFNLCEFQHLCKLSKIALKFTEELQYCTW